MANLSTKGIKTFYDYHGVLTQKQAKWYYKLDKCPKYFVKKHNKPIGGRIELVGHPRVQVCVDLFDDAAYKREGGNPYDWYHKPGYSFMTVGGQGWERCFRYGKECTVSEFKCPAWKPFCLVSDWSRGDLEYILLESWEEIFDYASDRDFRGTLCVYKNPVQD